ncbi:MAG TPA: sigma-70 family RNA polymerase sigma factor [Planctomycetota bacterium]|nr:sigma-70 family RNA polymerase sigma factor [Planctomycetota bacterium]
MPPDPRATPDAQVLTELAWVRNLARRLLADPSLADDVAQDTWLAARLHPPATGGGVRNWLAVVVRNRVHRLARADRRRVARELAAAERATEDPADVVERAALHREMTAAVMELDEPYRSAVLLRYLDELPAPEVARRQGITHDAARKRISRGLQMLRERLDHLHPGGFAAWSLAWAHHLQSGAAVVAAGAGLVLPSILAMNLKLVLACVASLAVLLAWLCWPDTDSAAQRTVAERGEAATVQAPAREPGQPAVPSLRSLATAASDTLVVEVFDERQQPRPQVVVIALRDGELLRQGATDEQGRAELASAHGATEVLLAQRGVVPVRVPLGATSPHRLTFAGANEVAGEVRGDPGRPVELRLEHDREAPCWAGLGAKAQRALADLGSTPRALVVPLGADRRFAFRGLSADWTGALATVAAWNLREPSHRGAVEHGTQLLLLEPAQGIVLELQPPVFVRGRIVAGAEPVAGLSVAVLDAVSAPGEELRSVKSAADGRFETSMRRPERGDGAMRAELLLQSRGGVLLQHRVTADPGAEVVELGDLEVGRALAVHVLGAEGKPLAGASVHVGTVAGSVVSVETDPTGTALLEAIPPDAHEVVVRAASYRMTSVAVPAAAADAHAGLTVQLQRGNGVLVVVVEPDGSPAKNVRLRVVADHFPFVAPGDTTAKGPAGPFDCIFEVEGEGRRELDNLEPGLLLHLSAVDDLGQDVGHTDFVCPPPERWDHVTITTQRTSFRWRGIVRDERGRAVPRARVYLEAMQQRGFALDAHTGADGRFEIGPFHEPLGSLHLEVTHPAFVPCVRNDQAVREGAPELEVTLMRGRTLVARILQQNGQPVQAKGVYVALDGGGAGVGKAIEPGVYEFENLARSPGTLTVTLGGRDFKAAVAPHAEAVELRVPDLATVSVQVSNAAAPVAGARVCVVVTPLEPAGSVDRQYFPPGEDTPKPITMQLPPGRYRVQLERRRFGPRVEVELLGEARELEFAGGEFRELLLP